MIWGTAVPFLSYIADSAILGFNDGNDTEIDRDPNLFFSTWISVILCLLLVTNIFRASPVTQDWVLLATFSFALMASSIVFFNSEHFTINEDGTQEALPPCTNTTDIRDSTCTRATLGFYLGLWSGIISLLMVCLYRCPAWLHFVVSLPLLVFWGVAVAYITFNAKNGVAAGILYFSCWIAAFTSIDLTTMNLIRVLKSRKQRKAQETVQAATSNTNVVPQDESAVLAPTNQLSTQTAYGDMLAVPTKGGEEHEQESNTGMEQATSKRVSFTFRHLTIPHSNDNYDDDDEIIHS